MPWQLRPVPITGNACSQRLETAVPRVGNGRSQCVETSVSYSGNERFPVGKRTSQTMIDFGRQNLLQHIPQAGHGFLQLGIDGLDADAQFFGHLDIALLLFADADEDLAATFGQAVQCLDVAGKELFADEALLGRRVGSVAFGEFGGEGIASARFLFQVVERGVAGKDEAIVLDVLHGRQRVALLPQGEEHVEHYLLRPLLVLQVMVGNAEQAVVGQVIEALESPFRAFLLHLSQVFSDFLFGHGYTFFSCICGHKDRFWA